MEGKQYVIDRVEKLIDDGVIQFSAYSWCFNMVDMIVKSDVFIDHEFILTVKEDDWNAGPSKAVASEIADAILDGSIQFAKEQGECAYDG